MKNVSLTLKGAQKLPNLHSSQKCWHDIYYNKKIPQSVGWIYPYFYKCIFPNPTPEHSNNHSKWWVSNTNINIQLTYILSKLFAAYIPQIVAAYIQYKFIFQQIYIPQQCTRRAHRNSNNTSSPQVLAWYIQYPHMCSTDIYSPNCWLYISNNIFIHLKM